MRTGDKRKRRSPSPDLRGATALVTGGARRIGREIALALAREGANVVIHFRETSVADLDETGSEIRDLGVRFWTIGADLERDGECEKLITRVLAMAGSLDILINNASIFLPGTIDNETFENFGRQMKVNAWGPLILSREFFHAGGPGKIINLLDTRIRGYDWSHVGYILSKHVLAVLTGMTALAFAPRVTVNAVAPGLILPPAGKGPSYLNALAKKLPLKRRGGPSDIASAVLYLLRSEFLTGQIIFVDGGAHLMEAAWTAY